MQRRERFIYMKIKNYLIGEYDKSVMHLFGSSLCLGVAIYWTLQGQARLAVMTLYKVELPDLF